MPYTFDGANKIIYLTGNTTAFDVADLYSRWKDWVQEGDNAKWVNAFDLSVGGDDLGGGKFAGAYYFLTNGWHIQPEEQNYKLVVNGNLFPIPSTEPLFLSTVGSYNVLIEMQTSQLTQALGSTWTDSEKTFLLQNQEKVRKILTNRSKVVSNTLTIYDDDGITPFMQFELWDSGGAPTNTNVREITNA